MIECNRFTLDNGLRVVHNYDASTAMVAVNLLYDVGSRDESPELTGMAHLFEHLMFGGSINVPNFDHELQIAGGKSNAFTSKDFTNFYDIIPAQNTETALRIESDRMLQLAFSDKALTVQKSVVTEEFRQVCLNKPYGDISHHLLPAIYKQHPYGWPVIGKEISHIEKVTQEDVKSFFYSHYAPNNAIMTISGNVTFDKVKDLVYRWFEEIPRREIAARDYPQEPAQTEPRIVEAKASVPVPNPAITIAYRMDGYGTEQFYAADLITDLLSDGRSSILYRKLLMGSGLFSSIDASIQGYEEPGLLLISGHLTESGDKAIDKAISSINEIIDEFSNTMVSEYDLTRALNRRESGEMFESISYLNKAINMARCEIHDSDINELMEPFRKFTPELITKYSREIFQPKNSTTLIYNR